MSRITLTFEDAPGGVAVSLTQDGQGFDDKSQAHRTANMVMNFLDDMEAATREAEAAERAKSVIVSTKRSIQVVRG